MYITPTVTSLSNGVTGAAVEDHRLAAGREPGDAERVLDVRFLGAVEHRATRSGRRCCSLTATLLTSSSESLFSNFVISSSPSKILSMCSRIFAWAELGFQHVLELPAEDASTPTEVRLEDLTDVHAARNAERVEHDVDRAAVLRGRACPLPEGSG